MEEEGRDSQGETPIPVMILPMRSIVHEGAVAHQIHPIMNMSCPNKYTIVSQRSNERRAPGLLPKSKAVGLNMTLPIPRNSMYTPVVSAILVKLTPNCSERV